MVIMKKQGVFTIFKTNYQSKKKKCHDKTLHSSTLQQTVNDVLPRFETWQGKSTNGKKTFSRIALIRMEWFSNRVILHFWLWKFYNYSHKTIKMQNFKWWHNESDNLNMSLKLNYLKNVQIWRWFDCSLN